MDRSHILEFDFSAMVSVRNRDTIRFDIDDLLARIGELGYLPEGAAACKQVRGIMAERKLELPIMRAVYRVLDRSAEPTDVAEALAWLRENATPLATAWIEPRTAAV